MTSQFTANRSKNKRKKKVSKHRREDGVVVAAVLRESGGHGFEHRRLYLSLMLSRKENKNVNGSVQLGGRWRVPKTGRRPQRSQTPTAARGALHRWPACCPHLGRLPRRPAPWLPFHGLPRRPRPCLHRRGLPRRPAPASADSPWPGRGFSVQAYLKHGRWSGAYVEMVVLPGHVATRIRGCSSTVHSCRVCHDRYDQDDVSCCRRQGHRCRADQFSRTLWQLVSFSLCSISLPTFHNNFIYNGRV